MNSPAREERQTTEIFSVNNGSFCFQIEIPPRLVLNHSFVIASISANRLVEMWTCKCRADFHSRPWFLMVVPSEVQLTTIAWLIYSEKIFALCLLERGPSCAQRQLGRTIRCSSMPPSFHLSSNFLLVFTMKSPFKHSFPSSSIWLSSIIPHTPTLHIPCGDNHVPCASGMKWRVGIQLHIINAHTHYTH